MTETDAQLTEDLLALGLANGLDAVGVAANDAFPEVRASLEARVEQGLAGPLRFTFDDPATAADPSVTFEMTTLPS